MRFFFALVLFLLVRFSRGQDPPTVYEYFAADGRNSGLVADADGFRLNGKPIRIISGAMHYFRIHPDYWRDRMRKLRATGANTLETYVPWNLHEPYAGVYDFGNGTNEFSSFLDVKRYIEMAMEEDLLVIFRPGPYICSEWEFGGLPSWLNTIPGMKVRSSNAPYENRVRLFFDQLLPPLKDLQWMNGGPIIMLQIENEYGAFGTEDKDHLEFIKTVFLDNNFTEFLVTSDSPLTGADKGAIPGVLQTANFYDNAAGQLNALLRLQPDKPVLVMEYWSGWFDHWYEPFHNYRPVSVFEDNLYTIFNYRGSVNFYMFHGGTSFGFMAGANVIPFFPDYLPDVSTYDYNAPLSESGDYTEKYHVIRNLTEIYAIPHFWRPEMPLESKKVAYPNLTIQSYLEWDDIISQVPETHKFTFVNRIVAMEELPLHNGNGQSYGYILYRIRAPMGNESVVEIGRARDMAMLIVDSEIKSSPPTNHSQLLTDFGYWTRSPQQQALTFETNQVTQRVVDLLVENMGRVNFGGPTEFEYWKGLHEGWIAVDGVRPTVIETMALEFRSDWVQSLTGWKPYTNGTLVKAPTLMKATFTILDEPADTWLNMRDWHKGVVFVNGLNLGRYFKVGPPHTMYIPAPLLQRGQNTVIVFEQFKPDTYLTFSDFPILGNFQ